MNVQTAPSPYTSVGAGPMPMGNPPVLGQQVPGTTGGLPALGGLSVAQNPLAKQLQSYGRGDDSMLVHMTPDEVNSLQGLAMASGGSLTINPHTGLPEAGWLGKLLPMLAGIGLNFVLPGSGLVAQLGGKAVTAGLMTGLGTAAITGDLKEGLMAGLGAYGGASLAGGVKQALGTGVKTATSAVPTAAPTLAAPTAVPGLSQITNGALQNMAPVAAGSAAPAMAQITNGALQNMASSAGQIAGGVAGGIGTDAATQAAINAAAQGGIGAANVAKTGLPGLMQGFSNTAKGSMTGFGAKIATPLALMGATNTLSNAFSPSGVKDQQTGAVDNSYQGPYTAQARGATFAPSTADILGSSKERDYFAVDVPEVYNMQGQTVQPGSQTEPGTQIFQPVLNPNAKKGENMYSFQPTTYKPSMPPVQQGQDNSPQNPLVRKMLGLPPLGYADGGSVHMDEGSFVMPARETAEFGKGSTEAGQKALAALGGIPIKGAGDGVSDSIPARIGGSTDARVANGEVLFQRSDVERIGGGSHKRGTEKLYDMMRKAEQSRKKAPRGGGGLDLLKAARG